MKKTAFLILALFICWYSSCKREQIFIEDGDLAFSSDSIFFDTLFSGFDSPTERVLIYNNTDHNILVSAIFLENGPASDYSLIIDGIESDQVNDFEILEGDSVLIFVKYNSQLQDNFSRDKIIFQVGGWTGNVDIEGFVLDAVFLKDTVLSGMQIFDPSKKYVIDGVLMVAENASLTIPAGTQIFFTSRKDSNFNFISRIDVWGRLVANGTKGNEVVFQQTRFGEDYEETAGQWRGIRFASTSVNSVLTHSLIKNAVIGIEVNYITASSFAKLKLDRCEIRNCAAYGMLGLGFADQNSNGFMIEGENCLIHNCKEGTFYAFGGGDYKFSNCTFANYTLDFIRNAPQIGISNFYELMGYTYPIEAQFTNCIVWGSEDEEVAFDTAASGPFNFNVFFNTCMVRVDEVLIKGPGNIINQGNNYPGFVDPFAGPTEERSYRLTMASPAKDIGIDMSVYYDLDLDDWPRPSNQPNDLGCYEYY